MCRSPYTSRLTVLRSQPHSAPRHVCRNTISFNPDRGTLWSSRLLLMYLQLHLLMRESIGKGMLTGLAF